MLIRHDVRTKQTDGKTDRQHLHSQVSKFGARSGSPQLFQLLHSYSQGYHILQLVLRLFYFLTIFVQLMYIQLQDHIIVHVLLKHCRLSYGMKVVERDGTICSGRLYLVAGYWMFMYCLYFALMLVLTCMYFEAYQKGLPTGYFIKFIVVMLCVCVGQGGGGNE